VHMMVDNTFTPPNSPEAVKATRRRMITAAAKEAGISIWKLTCTRCRGSGTVFVPDAAGGSDSYYVPCFLCNGVGLIHPKDKRAANTIKENIQLHKETLTRAVKRGLEKHWCNTAFDEEIIDEIISRAKPDLGSKYKIIIPDYLYERLKRIPDSLRIDR